MICGIGAEFDNAVTSLLEGMLGILNNPTKVADYLSLDGSESMFHGLWDGSIFTTTSDILDVTYKLCQSIGIMLVVLFFLLDLLDKTAQGDMTLEKMIPSFIKFGIGAFFVLQTRDFYLTFIKFGDAFLSETASIAEGNANMVQFGDILDGQTTAGKLLTAILCIFPWLVGQVCTLLIYFTAISRGIEIALRFSFIPMAVADVYGQGTNSTGFRYLKKFMALCLQGGAILILLSLTNVIFVTAFSEVSDLGEFSEVFSIIGFAITTILPIECAMTGLVLRSQQIINDVLGV